MVIPLFAGLGIVFFFRNKITAIEQRFSAGTATS